MNAQDHTETKLLEPRLLRLFDALFTTGSVTKAAEKLGQSQPTISIWLARLRKELDDPLFIRSAQGMLPTPRAEALIGAARQALEMLRRLAELRSEFDPATAKRRFTICMTDASHITLLPAILAHVRRVAPGIRIQAAQIGGDTPRMLQSGEADLALGYISDLDAGHFQQALFPQDWVCLANANHARIRDRINAKDFRREAHVLIRSGTGHQLLADALQEQRMVLDIALELPGFLGLPAIVGTTDLIATLPRHIGETLAHYYGLRVLNCPLPIAGFTVKQYWHARFHHDRASQWLRDVCGELFQQQEVRGLHRSGQPKKRRPRGLPS
ncbi:LysR family transcriptional regulator [Bradyrhizobium manausense]|uniref:LysR family transcriptional regulator n=1 Tax=Bradyrhizobium TaxID=374 RepID=UPI001BAE2C34|nr:MULTISPECIES: LysR family transcriptional regulator [Bradyrhizobium]MBR0825667.1 LysR family transcriptional regulator [Bradyrhizobium manausense]UVO31381.1 LysR family transcriptional regulator [Bradyrhizobium arachidis]